MRDWTGARRNRTLTRTAHARASARIAGSRTVVGCIRRRWRRGVCVRRMLLGQTEPSDLSTDCIPPCAPFLSEPWPGIPIRAESPRCGFVRGRSLRLNWEFASDRPGNAYIATGKSGVKIADPAETRALLDFV